MTAYGMAKWPDRLARIPQAHEGAIIARVQSMRTRGGHVPEPLSFAESQAYLRRVDRVRKRGVTVPQPLNASPRRDSATTPPPEVAAVRAGSIQEIKHERSSDS
jgi:hypothetical protein